MARRRYPEPKDYTRRYDAIPLPEWTPARQKRIDYFRFRAELPYGVYVVSGGEEVLFDRFYRPMFRRGVDGAVSPCDPDERIQNIAGQYWFYKDGNNPSLSRETYDMCIAVLREWGVWVEEFRWVDWQHQRGPVGVHAVNVTEAATH